jgi:hypothetical protein
MTIDGKDYILIGCRQQLDAIQLDDGGTSLSNLISTRVKVNKGDADLGPNERIGERGSPTSYEYTRDGNYIVFRDIDMRVSAGYNHGATGDNLTDVETFPDEMLWNPLDFSGTMIGYKVKDAVSGTPGQLYNELRSLLNNLDADVWDGEDGGTDPITSVDNDDVSRDNYQEGWIYPHRPVISYVKVAVTELFGTTISVWGRRYIRS